MESQARENEYAMLDTFLFQIVLPLIVFKDKCIFKILRARRDRCCVKYIGIDNDTLTIAEFKKNI